MVVGFANNVSHLWKNFLTNVKNLVDIGLIAKLLHAHEHVDQSYGNLSMQNSVAIVLSFFIEKDSHNMD